MPSKCSIVGCGATKSSNQPNLTYHRLPKNENKRRAWLEAIGKENLRENTQYIYICSLHFEEQTFNKTLDILRLKDEAVPTLLLKDQIRKVHSLKEKVATQKRKIKYLNETVRRQKLKIASFQEIIKDLKERNMVSQEECAGPKDFLLRQVSKAKGLSLEKQYTEEVSKFALTLYFLSPRAYDFVRSTYDSCLPHPRTLCKWYQNVNTEPSFCKEAFDALKVQVEICEVVGLVIVCALILDDMSIRKSLCWDSKPQKYHGRVNIGLKDEGDSLEGANQCLVFLVNCINGKWKLPVAYFLITSLNGEQKASLLQICLQKRKDAGVTIASVTCDGPAANFSMFQNLGCNFVSDQKKLFLKATMKLLTVSLTHVIL